VPGHAKSAHALLDSVARLWPSYLAYVVSFSTIGAVWLGHSAITEYLERIDGGFIRLNLLVLLLVSFRRSRPGCSRATSARTARSASLPRSTVPACS